MIDEDDLPGYLIDAIHTALKNGLTGLTLFRIGTGTPQWQASSRWHGRDGYSVHILPELTDAAIAALSAHPIKVQPFVSVPENSGSGTVSQVAPDAVGFFD